MGPRSFDRGNGKRRPDSYISQAASMGPRSFDRGNGQDDVAGRAERLAASMGPRSFDRGNAAQAAGNYAGALKLQWGRGLSTAEIPPMPSDFRGRKTAAPLKLANSILPWSFWAAFPRSKDRGPIEAEVDA